jgi:Uma2 family endonuclease
MSADVIKRRFTADEYQRMGQVGILPERRLELIDGEVLVMTPIGTRHNAAVNRTNRVLVGLVGDQAIVQVQGSIRLDGYSEPQPDLALLTPRADDYVSRHPGPADILLLIEVSDSSIDYDVGRKAALYAASAIREYWVADLEKGELVVHLDPEGHAYRAIRRYRRGASIAPEALPDCALATDILLVE